MFGGLRKKNAQLRVSPWVCMKIPLHTMNHKITAIVGACIALCLAQPLLAQSTGNQRHHKHNKRVELFRKLDTNGDGVLSKKEFLVLAEKARHPEKARKRLIKRFRKLDTNHDGVLSLKEFLAAPHHKRKHHHHGQPAIQPATQSAPATPANG